MQSTETAEGAFIHGTVRAYNKMKCRCGACREANRQQMAAYRLKRFGDRRRRGIDEYRAMHNKLARELGKARDYPCEFCGTQADDWALDTSSVHIRRDPENGVGLSWSDRMADYRALCRACHRRYDEGWADPTSPQAKQVSEGGRGRRSGGKCRNGHDISADGTLRTRRTGTPECIECSRERVRRYREKVRHADANGRASDKRVVRV